MQAGEEMSSALASSQDCPAHAKADDVTPTWGYRLDTWVQSLFPICGGALGWRTTAPRRWCSNELALAEGFVSRGRLGIKSGPCSACASLRGTAQGEGSLPAFWERL